MTPTHKRSIYRKHWGRQKHLANPWPDVICIVTLTLILLLTGYMHLRPPRPKGTGVPAEPALSLSCERASCRVSRTLKQTHSGVQNVGALELNQFLFRALILSRPASARLQTISTQEKKAVCLWFNTVVFLQAALRRLTRTRFSWKGTSRLFFFLRRKVEMRREGSAGAPDQLGPPPNWSSHLTRACNGRFIPCMNDGGFPATISVNYGCPVGVIPSFRTRFPAQRGWLTAYPSHCSAIGPL